LHIDNWCEKKTLSTYAKNNNQLINPVIENLIWKFFINISLGLYYLHSKNIIHWDLKLLNVFVNKDNIAKIGDLGCAKYIDFNK
jgi:serine/threonine protein kinase